MTFASSDLFVQLNYFDTFEFTPEKRKCSKNIPTTDLDHDFVRKTSILFRPTFDRCNCYLSNVKPFECETCHQCFIRKDHLISHQRTHSTEMFFCTLCNFKTTRNDSLKRHFKKHADIIDPNASIESYIQRIDTADSRISPNSLLRNDFNYTKITIKKTLLCD